MQDHECLDKENTAERFNKPYPNLEITNGELSEEELNAEVAEIIKILEVLRVSEVRLECWHGVAHIPVIEIPMALSETLPQDRFDRWAGTYSPMDLTIIAEDLNLEFEFCHHSEMHVRTEDQQLLLTFLLRWRSLSYAIHRRCGDHWA